MPVRAEFWGSPAPARWFGLSRRIFLWSPRPSASGGSSLIRRRLPAFPLATLRPGAFLSWWLALVLLPFHNLMVGRVLLLGIGYVLLVPLLRPAAVSQNQAGTGWWPMFRGDSRLWGISDTALPDSLKLRWTYQAKESIESSAAIVDGIAYVARQTGQSTPSIWPAARPAGNTRRRDPWRVFALRLRTELFVRGCPGLAVFMP